MNHFIVYFYIYVLPILLYFIFDTSITSFYLVVLIVLYLHGMRTSVLHITISGVLYDAICTYNLFASAIVGNLFVIAMIMFFGRGLRNTNYILLYVFIMLPIYILFDFTFCVLDSLRFDVYNYFDLLWLNIKYMYLSALIANVFLMIYPQSAHRL